MSILSQHLQKFATLNLFREINACKLNQLESVVTEYFLYLLHKSDLVHRVEIDIPLAFPSMTSKGNRFPNIVSAGENN